MSLAVGSGNFMNFVLLRFALIAGGVLVLVIIVFAVLMMLKRRGSVDQATIDKARKHVGPIARGLYENRRELRRGRSGRSGLLGALISVLSDRDRRR